MRVPTSYGLAPGFGHWARLGTKPLTNRSTSDRDEHGRSKAVCGQCHMRQRPSFRRGPLACGVTKSSVRFGGADTSDGIASIRCCLPFGVAANAGKVKAVGRPQSCSRQRDSPHREPSHHGKE